MPEFKKVDSNLIQNKEYRALLLLADPDEKMLDKYINDSDVFTCHCDNKLAGICAVLKISQNETELKNLAIVPEFQRQGLGREFVKFLNREYCTKAVKIIVGTSESGISFYQKCGFEFSHVIKNFFIDNYPNPIFEGGLQCKDMIYLQYNIL